MNWLVEKLNGGYGGSMNFKDKIMKKERIKFLLYFIILLIIEIFIALFVHDKFVRPYLGDMLVVVVLYCFIRIFIPRKVGILPLYIFIFAVIIEVLQYFNLIKILGLENNAFLTIVLGSIFDVKDIVCYGIGCIFIWLYEIYVKQ